MKKKSNNGEGLAEFGEAPEAVIDDDVVMAFKQVVNKKLMWAIAAIDNVHVTLVKTGDRESSLEALREELSDEPYYVVLRFEAMREDYSKINKVIFATYVPDSCTSLKKKFALHNFKASVAAKSNCHAEMQINDKHDLSARQFHGTFNI